MKAKTLNNVRRKILPDLRSNYCSPFWRVIYIVCTILVFSYIFFEVLDLDGSDFPLKRHPLERTVIVAEVAKDTEQAYPLGRLELWANVSILASVLPSELARFHIMQVLIFATPVFARSRGYRIALPRSSPSDPFHAL
jgi:hypothetical protein